MNTRLNSSNGHLIVVTLLIAMSGCATTQPQGRAPATGDQVASPSPAVPSVGTDVACIYPELREHLLHMMELDQARRKALPANGPAQEQVEALAYIDACNTKRMKQIVRDYGWPTRSLVGDDGSHAAWLLVQHADQDPVFQSRCLDLMHAELTVGEVFPQDVAYLTDRVLVHQNQPQLYGTQFHQVDGKMVPQPIQDPLTVDAHRAEVGLSNMADYKKLMKT
ncbi:MAG: DUF6624 domain-containing protein [Phycisphaerae bacterium]